jgi:hypothetical protein
MHVPEETTEYNGHMNPQEIMDWVLMRDIAGVLDQMPLDDGIAAEESIGATRREVVLEAAQKRLTEEATRLEQEQQALKQAKALLKTVTSIAPETDELITLLDAPFTILLWGATYEPYKPPTPAYRDFRSKIDKVVGHDQKAITIGKAASMLTSKFPTENKENETVSELHPGKGLTILKPSLKSDEVYTYFGLGDTTRKLAFKAIRAFTQES